MKTSTLSQLAPLLLAITLTSCSPPEPAAVPVAPEHKPLVVFLVRHAEKVDNNQDPELSEAGRQRAATLAEALRSSDIEYVHSSDYIRTRDTATPAAAEHGLEVALYDPRDLPALAEKLRAAGGRHLVVGHSNTTPEMVELLGGDAGAAIDEPGEYDRLYVVSIGSDGRTNSVMMRYGTAFLQPAPVEIVPITHGSLILKWNGQVIHVDPWSRGNYEGQPKADLILITDIHGDHLDPAQVEAVKKSGTIILAPAAVQASLSEARVLNNGERMEALGIGIEAIPMYNLQRGPEEGKLFHDKGRGNGYVLTLGAERVYISGDTECVPEIEALQNIDHAFMCMNLPYTMPPPEAAACVNSFRPKRVYPYHYRDSDVEEFRQAVTAGVEVILLKWY